MSREDKWGVACTIVAVFGLVATFAGLGAAVLVVTLGSFVAGCFYYRHTVRRSVREGY